MDIIRDVEYGLRTLARSPWFTAVSVLTLALGIGTNTALYSVVDAVLLRSTGYADPATLVQISGTNRQGQAVGVSLADMQSFRTRAHSVARNRRFARTDIHHDGRERAAECLRPARFPTSALPSSGPRRCSAGSSAAGDFQSGAPPVAVIAHRLWQTAFQGDPRIIGRRVLSEWNRALQSPA